jgi:hypothetical protein
MRLLRVMLVVYRPLIMEEVDSVTGLSDDEVAIEVLVDRCAHLSKSEKLTSSLFINQLEITWARRMDNLYSTPMNTMDIVNCTELSILSISTTQGQPC